MVSRQGDPDANEHARQKTDEETKPGRVAHRALAQVENPRRLVFVHRPESAPRIAGRKIALRISKPLAQRRSLEPVWN
jgi:hypothetical protein